MDFFAVGKHNRRNWSEVVPGADVTSEEISKCEASMIESQLAAIVRVQAMPEGNLFVCLRGESAYLVNAKDGSTLTRYSSGKAVPRKATFYVVPRLLRDDTFTPRPRTGACMYSTQGQAPCYLPCSVQAVEWMQREREWREHERCLG